MAILATRCGETIVAEIDAARSDTKENLTVIAHADFDRIVLVVTSQAEVRHIGRPWGLLQAARRCSY